MSEKLQKILARADFGSRRECERLISSGRVTVNGRAATLGDRANVLADTIEVDGKRLEHAPRIYIMLNKPKGVLSSMEDELRRGRPTLRTLVDLPGHYYPVGRLDKQSEGLMILTNDGELTHRITHPSFRHIKVYEAIVTGEISYRAVLAWQQGILLDGKQTAPATIVVLNRQRDHSKLRITLTEGRKRQIRRVAAHLGFPVTKLVRVQIGPVKLGDLQPGCWRHLTSEEQSALHRSLHAHSVEVPPGEGNRLEP